MAAAPVRAFDSKGVDLLAAFNDGIYWQDNTPATDEDTICSGDGPAAAVDSGVQNVMATPPDASGPFGAGMRKVYISVVIDDVGLDQKRSARTIALPANVTLAFLPYAGNIQAQAAQAAAKGHELMVHLPMEPSRMSADPGPDYLGVAHTAEELEKRIARNLDAFSGYKGVNNHMGSAFTKHAPGLDVLMRALKKRGVYFLDSKTAPDSIAEDMARAKGIPVTHRDVFIDHFETAEQVRAALEKTERIARITGYAVAIGHPKDVTLDALELWLPTLAAKGIELIPLSEMIEKRHAAHKSYSAAAVKPAGLGE
ncbi:MAG: divergent polysaccharide deacetylase family protein [Alphaproteobacteria bacterium]|nr:divergent polysaccharide deacetylase family protein [Alphaproteobacteria bacterium]